MSKKLDMETEIKAINTIAVAASYALEQGVIPEHFVSRKQVEKALSLLEEKIGEYIIKLKKKDEGKTIIVHIDSDGIIKSEEC